MNRLTKKIEEGFYTTPNINSTDDLKYKLGQLEDLLEKYEIKDVEELELCQTSGYVWRFKGDTFESRRLRKEYDRAKNLGNYARKRNV